MENNTSPNTLDPAVSARLAHGFRRTLLFGLTPSFKKTSSQDKYGYLFCEKDMSQGLPFSEVNQVLLEELGHRMLDKTLSTEPGGRGELDSGYTYFGQFVDHDLTLDADSSTRRVQDARGLINYRTPNMDLDSLYGDGPAVSPFMYNEQLTKFIIGIPSGADTNSGLSLQQRELDLPRNAAGVAIIGDPRNNENLFVAQLHMSLLRFHNAVVDALQAKNPSLEDHDLFTQAQQEVRRHYQWVVIHDYLRTIVGQDIINDVLKKGLKFFSRRKFRLCTQ